MGFFFLPLPLLPFLLHLKRFLCYNMSKRQTSELQGSSRDNFKGTESKCVSGDPTAGSWCFGSSALTKPNFSVKC